MDDKECVLCCLDGDEAAIRFFVEKFHSPIFVLCLRRLQNREDAEDVTQDALIRAIRYLRGWDSTRPLKPWVFRIALNCCANLLRQRNRQVQIIETVIEPAAKDDQNDSIELTEAFQLALNKIRKQYRTCFLLFYVQELSIPRIAEIIGSPEGTVKTWLHRARLDLGRLLVSQGVVTKDGYEVY